MQKFEDPLMKKNNKLLKNIKGNLEELELMYSNISREEVSIYRFYHQSFKVYHLQERTKAVVELLKKISPHKDKNEINKYFLEIFEAGTGKVWNLSHNEKWTEVCRPIVEAFFHAKFFLEMAVKYGKELDEAPCMLPSGWAALLYFYNIR